MRQHSQRCIFERLDTVMIALDNHDSPSNQESCLFPGAGAAALTRKGSRILPLAGLQMRRIFVSGHDAVSSVVLLYKLR